jgi:hypothetical protein
MVRILGPLLAGLIVGLVVGAGGFWLFGEGSGAPSLGSSGASRSSASHDAHASASDATPPAPVTAERAVAREESGAPLPSQVSASVTALAKSVPSPKVEKGTKVLSGHATDPQGRPLDGVTVRAVRQKDRRPERVKRGEELTALPTLEERLRDAVKAHYQALADQRETTSDGDGAWKLDGLGDGDWRVSAGKTGFSFTTARDLVKPDAVVDFRATLVVRVPVAVKLPDGSTPDEVSIVFVGDRRSGRRVEGWRSDSPWLALEPGSYELKATLGDLETGPPWPGFLTSDSQRVNVRNEEAPQELTFTLKGAPGITGHVKLAPADVEDQLTVKLLPIQSGKEPDLTQLVNSNKQTRVDPREGVYAFKDLSPGRYLIGATRGWQAPVFVHAEVSVADSMVTQDLVVPPLEKSDCIVTKVFSPEGLPLDKVDFTMVYHVHQDGQNDNEWQNGVFAARRGVGIFWVVPPHGDGYANQMQGTTTTRCELEARSTQFGSRRVDVSGPGAEVEIRFGDPATLVVTIPGYVGSGYEGRVRLSVEKQSANPGGRQWFDGNDNPLGAEGKQTFGPLESGPVRIAMTIQNENNSWWQAMRVGQIDLTLRSGENSALFPIPALYSVTIEVQNGANGSVQLQHRSERGQSNDDFNNNGGTYGQLDAQGRVTFSGLPAGDYVAQVWGGNGVSGSMNLRIPCGSVVQFAPRVNNCLQVWINDQNGKIAKAGFQNGDKVIAIAGTPLNNVKEDLESIVAANVAKDAVSFTVLRGDKTLDLSFDVKAMLTHEISGGGFNPSARE